MEITATGEEYLKIFLENPPSETHRSRNDYFRYLEGLSIRESAGYRTYKKWFYKLVEADRIDPSDFPWMKEYTNRTSEKLPEQSDRTPSPDDKNNESWDQSSDTKAKWELRGHYENIHTLDDALSYSNVDMNTWEVERHKFNSWESFLKNNDGKPEKVTLIQVSVWFKKKIDHGISWSEVHKQVKNYINKTKINRVNGSGVGFVATSDFHFGAYIDDLIRSDKFNISILTEYLMRTADIVNSKGYKSVHLAFLGDFIESFTGLNHRNSWKGLGKGMYGMNSVILCFEILLDAFIKRVNNVDGIYLVSGNHDRVTDDKGSDSKGEVGEILHYMLNRELKDIKVEYNPMVITKKIDGICYVITHGHLPFAQKELSKILFDHGVQGMYNVLIQGHLHSRRIKKTSRRKQYDWNEVKVVELDEANYRAIVAPSMFTGNFFSESLGHSSSAGFVLMENNGRGRLNYYDYCI